jgi:hypothetical protein
VFSNMGEGIVYLVMLYSGKTLKPVTQPIILLENGLMKFIVSEKSHTKQILYRKFPIDERKSEWLNSMLGDQLVFANDLNFKTTTFTYTFSQKPKYITYEIDVDLLESSQYCMYKNHDSTRAMVAEFEFYEEKGGYKKNAFQGYTQ